ncbi:MAG: hypothetical protein EOO65_02715 [Methanosarcinales archaeon]|nr:MAG: hypothetical protein EOO65_02715 [Methanosarcinales archaeon]
MAGRRGASTLSASAAATLTPKNEVRGSCSDSAWPAGRGALRASVAGAHGSDTKDESEHAMDRAEMHASAGALAGRHALASQIATAAQSGSGSQEYAAYASHGRLAVSAATVSSSAYARPEPAKWNIRAPHAAAASSTHSADALDTALAAVAVASATEGKEAYDSGPATGLRSPLYMAWQKTKSVYGSSETSAASQSRSTLVSSPREDAATSSTAMRGAGSIMGVDLLRPPAIASTHPCHKGLV